jgi:uncharacterized short protein YbdD (DUF466 family)
MHVVSHHSPRSPLRRACDGFVWYVTGLFGGHAYEKYLRYHRATGCSAPPMAEKEYWRDRQDRDDASQSRCC